MPLLLPVHVHSMLCCCWEKQAFSILWALSAFAIYVSNSEDGKFYWGYNRKWCKHHYKVLKIHKGANILMESKSNWNFYIYWILTLPFNNVKFWRWQIEDMYMYQEVVQTSLPSLENTQRERPLMTSDDFRWFWTYLSSPKIFTL